MHAFAVQGTTYGIIGEGSDKAVININGRCALVRLTWVTRNEQRVIDHVSKPMMLGDEPAFEHLLAHYARALNASVALIVC